VVLKRVVRLDRHLRPPVVTPWRGAGKRGSADGARCLRWPPEWRQPPAAPCSGSRAAPE
jgi:hypothetical protein